MSYQIWLDEKVEFEYIEIIFTWSSIMCRWHLVMISEDSIATFGIF